jgi:tetratricopeptide (TPR) repeat protein
VRDQEGRPGERLRLWDRLGELCMQLGRTEDALVAFEVALSLDPEDQARRIRLADLLLFNSAHDAKAIPLHQAVLRDNKQRLESYQALRTLYDRTGQKEKARAVADALAILATPSDDKKIESLFEGKHTKESASPARDSAPRTLSNEDWLVLSRLDVDLHLSALFALVAPAFAAERAKMRPPQGLPAREHEVPGPVAKVLTGVLATFGIPSPPVYIDREQIAPCKVALRSHNGVLVPVLVIGKRALDELDPHELAFGLARQLADLRNDRIARLMVPRAGELAQIIELATGLAADAGHAAKWLATSLHPVELDQTLTLGTRLKDRGVQPLRAAVDWLAATERAADRIGFVAVGDLENCVRVLERDPAAKEENRIVELVWSSITEEVLGVRGRVEGWVATATAAPGRAVL